MSQRRTEKIFILIIIIALLSLVFLPTIPVFYDWLSRPKPIINEQINPTSLSNGVNLPPEENSSFFKTQENKSKEETQSNNSPLQEKINLTLPSEVILTVPFTPQAPEAIWDELYKEACEEAALIIVHYYLKDEDLNKEKVKKEILALVDWQMKNWGGHRDLTIEEVGNLARQYYGYQKIKIQYNITIDQIKEELAKGNPVILPAAGRLLKNPYFRQPGPYYHMLVVIGYDQKNFITNDPGTKRGKSFVYSYQNLYQAIHDWPGQDKDILEGQKAMLVIEK